MAQVLQLGHAFSLEHQHVPVLYKEPTFLRVWSVRAPCRHRAGQLILKFDCWSLDGLDVHLMGVLMLTDVC